VDYYKVGILVDDFHAGIGGRVDRRSPISTTSPVARTVVRSGTFCRLPRLAQLQHLPKRAIRSSGDGAPECVQQGGGGPNLESQLGLLQTSVLVESANRTTILFGGVNDCTHPIPKVLWSIQSPSP